MEPDQRKLAERRAQELPAVRTTIVGGRPPGSGRGLGSIPRGIEVLVKKASVDPAFKEVLLVQRSRAADEIGLRLDVSEAAMLDLVPAEQLQGIIAKTKLEPSKRRAFLGKAAAVMLVALGASTNDNPADGQFVSRGVQAPAQIQPPVTQPATDPAPDLNGEAPPVTVLGIMPMPPRRTPVPKPATWPATLTTQQATDLPKLIEQLDAESFPEREEASRKIKEMGPGVIAPIEEVLKAATLGPEATARLQMIVKTAQASTRPARRVPDELRAVDGIRPVAGVMADPPADDEN